MNLQFIFPLTASLLFTFVVYYITLTAHELVHVQVNTYNGVVSEVEYNWNPLSQYGAQTIAKTNFSSQEAQDNAYFLHGLNEVITYNIAPFLGAIIWCLSYLTFSTMIKSNMEARR